MINRTECLTSNGKEMIIAVDSSVLIFLALGRRFSCTYSGKNSVSNCDISGSAVTITIWNRARSSGYLQFCISFMNGKPALDKVRHIKSLNTMMMYSLDFIYMIVHVNPRVTTDALHTQ